MKKLLLAAVCPGHVVDLRGDPFVDPRNDVEEFDELLSVVDHHWGPPTADEMRRAYKLVGDSSGVNSDDQGTAEETCTLVLVTPIPSSKCVVAFFPDDQHEILVEDPDETFEEEDEDGEL